MNTLARARAALAPYLIGMVRGIAAGGALLATYAAADYLAELHRFGHF